MREIERVFLDVNRNHCTEIKPSSAEFLSLPRVPQNDNFQRLFLWRFHGVVYPCCAEFDELTTTTTTAWSVVATTVCKASRCALGRVSEFICPPSQQSTENTCCSIAVPVKKGSGKQTKMIGYQPQTKIVLSCCVLCRVTTANILVMPRRLSTFPVFAGVCQSAILTRENHREKAFRSEQSMIWKYVSDLFFLVYCQYKNCYLESQAIRYIV